MQTTVENDEIETKVGETLGGADLVVVPTKSGMYSIECRGSGVAPAICHDLFTDLRLARRAVEQYRLANAAKFAKKEHLDEMVNQRLVRQAEAEDLKNGELDSTVQNGE